MVPGRRKLRNHRESLELGGERNYREITEKAQSWGVKETIEKSQFARQNQE